MKLSVVLATRNEEKNIRKCLLSIKNIADEIIVYDESSIDKTRKIAKELGARVFKVNHESNFHITKQKAISRAKGDWILQLDADERVSNDLKDEIIAVVREGRLVVTKDETRIRLFQKHQQLVEKRYGKLGSDDGEVVAYFIPRLNYFIGAPLRHAGVYPDAVIRLFKRGHGKLPAKSVHELLEVDGRVGWLTSDLIHDESPTLNRYVARNNRYTTLIARDLARTSVKKNFFSFINYVVLKPTYEFLVLYIRHKGFKDGMRGFIWSLLSAWRFPLAYFKYMTGEFKIS